MNSSTPETMSPALLTIEQTCQLLNISRAEWYRLNQSGVFAPLSVGLCRKVLYRKDEIESWIQAGFPNREQWQQINQIINERSIHMKDEKRFDPVGNFNFQNCVILGDVKSENIQNGNHKSFHKKIKVEKKNFPKISEIISVIIKFVYSWFK